MLHFNGTEFLHFHKIAGIYFFAAFQNGFAVYAYIAVYYKRFGVRPLGYKAGKL